MNFSSAAPSRTYTVSELTQELQNLLEITYPQIWVKGEVTNLTRSQLGHIYFSLKDDQAALRCVLFKSNRRQIETLPENGMQALAGGRLTVYKARGEYQLLINIMEDLGIGELWRRIEAVKKKLEADGLFAPDRKIPFPPLPARVAVITSPSGAAIRDMVKVLRLRQGEIHLILVPSLVQGPEAPADIIAALGKIEEFSRRRPDLPIDCVIVTRGGGSLEDLMAFNDENVSRAIDTFRNTTGIPIVSAIGHERDVTVADLVADHRAATPTAAAELISVESKILRERIETVERRIHDLVISRHLSPAAQDINNLVNRLKGAVIQLVSRRKEEIQEIHLRLEKIHPRRTLRETALRWKHLEQSLAAGLKSILEWYRGRWATFSGQLNSLSPLAVLERGYSITYHLPDRKIVTNSDQVAVGDPLEIKLARGALRCRAEKRLTNLHPTEGR